MEKFNKLSRAEMKNVTGGVLKFCTLYCQYYDGHNLYNVQSTVADCTPASEAACTFGGTVLSCSCGTM